MNVQFLEFLSFIPTFYTRKLLDNLMNPIGIMFQEYIVRNSRLVSVYKSFNFFKNS